MGVVRDLKRVGNYFSTEEEANEVLSKIKLILKDKSNGGKRH